MGPLPDPGLRRPGPALRRSRLPLTAIGFSAIAHVVVFGGMAVFVMWTGWRPEKGQVVNLVPMVAAVGTPNAPPAPSPLPTRPQAPGAPRVPQPEPEPKATTAPRAAPRREAPSLPAPSQTAALGAPTGSAAGQGALTLDVSDFPYAWWVRAAIAKVQDQWQRQNQFSEPPQKPQLLVEVQRDGSIARIPMIEKSSGNTMYDQAAVRAVMAASPLPKLPDEWAGGSVLRLHISFDLARRRCARAGPSSVSSPRSSCSSSPGC